MLKFGEHEGTYYPLACTISAMKFDTKPRLEFASHLTCQCCLKTRVPKSEEKYCNLIDEKCVKHSLGRIVDLDVLLKAQKVCSAQQTSLLGFVHITAFTSHYTYYH